MLPGPRVRLFDRIVIQGAAVLHSFFPFSLETPGAFFSFLRHEGVPFRCCFIAIRPALLLGNLSASLEGETYFLAPFFSRFLVEVQGFFLQHEGETFPYIYTFRFLPTVVFLSDRFHPLFFVVVERFFSIKVVRGTLLMNVLCYAFLFLFVFTDFLGLPQILAFYITSPPPPTLSPIP